VPFEEVLGLAGAGTAGGVGVAGVEGVVAPVAPVTVLFTVPSVFWRLGLPGCGDAAALGEEPLLGFDPGLADRLSPGSGSGKPPPPPPGLGGPPGRLDGTGVSGCGGHAGAVVCGP
jgi:hypothetical protein